jgi:hypothetical protein
MDTSPDTEGLPPSLRFLKWLVIILTATMIVGVITVVGLLVTRMPGPVPKLIVPEGLDLPAGTQPRAVTLGESWIAVVTDDDRILIFNPDGSLRQEIVIAPR